MDSSDTYDPLKEFNLKPVKTRFMTANLLKRSLAFIVDILLVNIIILTPFARLLDQLVPKKIDGESMQAMYYYITSHQDIATEIMVLVTAMFLFTMFYFMLMEKYTNQSFGKKLFNLYVINLEDAYNQQTVLTRISGWRIFLRNMMFLPFMPFVFLFVIDPIFIVTTRSRQRLSELLSKTLVIEVNG